MMKLYVQSKTVHDGAVLVAWCLSPELVSRAHADGKGRNLHVLLVAVPLDDYSIRGETRTLVRATDQMSFVRFRRPGRHRIYGIVLVGSEDAIRHTYFATLRGVWTTTVIDVRDGKVVCEEPEPRGEVRVDVPAGCFSKDPPAWEQKWVNWLHAGPPVDQCEYRRRRILAYTVKPLLAAVLGAAAAVTWMVHLIGAVLCLLFVGARINWWQGTITWSGPTLLSPRTYAAKHAKHWWSRALLTPLFWYAALGLTYFTHTVLMTVVFISCLALTFVAALVGVGKIFDRDIQRAAENRAKDLATDLDALVCNGERTVSIFALPRRKRTIRLRFEALKAKVCRPFAQ